MTFSPVLQALKLHDALEDAAIGRSKLKMSNSSMDAAIHQGRSVKNICCVGAGYVGMRSPFLKTALFPRRGACCLVVC